MRPPMIDSRVTTLLDAQRHSLHERTEKMFCALLIFQWIAGIAAAIWLSPLSWAGLHSSVHFHVWAAVILGGILTLFPVFLVFTRPAGPENKYVIAVAQVLYSALLIHLTGGRIETHFHIFGSLAFLSFYREWRVLALAAAVVGVDHLARGVYWPESVYGVLSPEPWRWLEHLGWVVFELFFLLRACRQSNEEMEGLARRQAELELLNGEFERRVQQRTEELSQAVKQTQLARAQAEDASRIKSEFLASMSHELRTPLNSIIGFSEILSDGTFGELNPKQERYVGNVSSSGRHLLSLVNDVLDLSRVEAGQLRLSLKSISLCEVLKSVSQPLAILAQKAGVELEFAEDSHPVMSDPARLKQILFNLLGNAVKFTPRGGRVWLSSEYLESGQVRFTVSDTGPGIPEAERERIFEEFQQLDMSYARNHQGTGLGLALTKRLVELHGGEIWVDSVVGSGSHFRFTLPAAPEEESEFLEPVPDSTLPTALVIESSAEARELLSLYLRDDYRVVQARSAAQAKVLALTQKPQVITLDLALRDRHGLDLLVELKAAPETAEIPVVIVSVQDERELGLACGAAECLLKPVRRDRFLNTLDRCLGRDGNEEKSVLIVDDEPKVLELLNDLATSRGYRVLLANSGKQALERVQKELPDAVILDLMMPEMTGFEVLSRLRERPESQNLPVVVYTSMDLEPEERAKLRASATSIQMKSDPKGELLRALRAACSHQEPEEVVS